MMSVESRLTITVTLTWINPNTSTANWIHKTAQIVHGILGAEFITLEDCKNSICLFQSGVSKKIWKHCRRSTDGLALGDRQRHANTCNTIKRKVAFVFYVNIHLKFLVKHRNYLLNITRGIPHRFFQFCIYFSGSILLI